MRAAPEDPALKKVINLILLLQVLFNVLGGNATLLGIRKHDVCPPIMNGDSWAKPAV